MNPGKLNKRIALLEQSAAPNSYGEVEDTWNEVVSMWANVRTLTGRALYQANQVHAEVTVKVIVRYRRDILENMRLRYGNRILEIVTVVNMNEENRFLEFSCKEVI
ncbi:phage head closure protein [Neobacillus mesonae]|uniref:phage head closure protein n=1 Tax=Neobacillus mesonae TaxID=1193713 RepID=UPI002E210CCE|nr:phage head closure protein [Neobacillus mesonae]MED4206591.1 phage head closure protein [Neobacillus mesonae]